jgi:hypothetical protein
MKFIDPEDAPMRPTPRRNSAKWRPIQEAIKDGKVVVLTPDEYEDELATRNSITISLRRWGTAVTIRKDSDTGDLYVFPKPEEEAPA